jgi:hypothetical protein
VETVASVQVFRDEGMTEAESGRPERIGGHRIDADVVAVKESTTFEPQIENFNDSLA